MQLPGQDCLAISGDLRPWNPQLLDRSSDGSGWSKRHRGKADQGPDYLGCDASPHPHEFPYFVRIQTPLRPDNNHDDICHEESDRCLPT